MTDSKLLDSSIWIDYLIKGSFKELIEESEVAKLSVLSLFEIKRKLLKQRINDNEILQKIAFVKNNSILIEVNEKISEKAAVLSEKNKLGAIDALIYATALMDNSEFVTLDNDFRNLEKVKVLEIS